ncbi:MAG TPA: bifunctional ADP-dependent NAD(P)H-hydrate dehydratase/NAD(P)H-hydrate epimerase, partial [Spirochaetes bacterium]|nr:bifunctional ADP-dependent NAD(P)H-hydrate dehydratase/NAD(P)H-hydrate epimerase [Spirochaetota bacterium]
ALATAGTGDVLAGIVGALLLRRGLSAYHAAGAGVYLHGLAADLAAGPAKVLRATDVIGSIGDALETLCV